MKSNFQENFAHNAQKILELTEEDRRKRQMYREVYDIIEHLEDRAREKIPDDFIAFLKTNMDTAHEVKIDYRKSINAQPLSTDTRIMLADIYEKYMKDK